MYLIAFLWRIVFSALLWRLRRQDGKKTNTHKVSLNHRTVGRSYRPEQPFYKLTSGLIPRRIFPMGKCSVLLPHPKLTPWSPTHLQETQRSLGHLLCDTSCWCVCVGSPEGATRVCLWGLRGCLRGRLTSFFSHSPSTCASQLKFHTRAGGWMQVCLTERKANTTIAASSILIDSYCLGQAEGRPWREGRDPEAEKREKAGESSPSLQTQDGLWGWGQKHPLRCKQYPTALLSRGGIHIGFIAAPV